MPSGQPKQTFKSGAKSSGNKPWYHLIPFFSFMPRLAARYEMGVRHGYGEDGWKSGLTDRDYIMDRANHTLEHLARAVDDLRNNRLHPPDDDLAGAMWGVVFLMSAQEALRAQESSPLNGKATNASAPICARCGHYHEALDTSTHTEKKQTIGNCTIVECLCKSYSYIPRVPSEPINLADM